MRRYQPAIAGGLLIGVLSVLPFVNFCCCLWVVIGGLLAAYLRQQGQAEPLDAADAALVGLMAGVLGALLFILAAAVMPWNSGPAAEQQIRALLDQNPQISAQARAMMVNLFAGRGILLVMVAIVLPVYAVFSMLGALLGLAMFRKKPPSPPAPVESGPTV
jgi:hypothetical protein